MKYSLRKKTKKTETKKCSDEHEHEAVTDDDKDDEVPATQEKVDNTDCPIG